MEKAYVPINIPTIAPTTLMEDVRLRTINPLLTATDKIGRDLHGLSQTVTTHAGKILNLESIEGMDAKELSHSILTESLLNIQSRMSAEVDVVVHNLGLSSNPRVWLPAIKPVGATLGEAEVYVGRKLVIINTGAQYTRVAGGDLVFDKNKTTNEYDLPVNCSLELVAQVSDTTVSGFSWRVMRCSPISLELASGTKTVDKWYVLPLAGQSNMWGCGEAPWDLNCNSSRIKQLGIQDSDQTAASSLTNLNLDTCPYGNRYEEFRPMVDSNLKMIPSVPCLDTAANGFHVGYHSPASGGIAAGIHRWGNTGLGHYLATALLPYIPEDYGILIVNASRPGGGVMASAGTYDATTMRPSSNANGHGDGHPFNLMLKDRVKLALEMNPENKLLPLIWMQGESDPEAAGHYAAFKNVITGWKKHLVDSGLDSRLPHGNIEHMKIICLGTTKVIYGDDCGFDYLSNMNHCVAKHGYRGRYDNYAYLMDHPDFMNPVTKEGYVTYVRVDVDEVGDFIETAMEENRANGTPGVFSSALDTHFSSKALQNKIPRLVLNAIGSSKAAYLTSVFHSKWARYVPGRKGMVSTDNIHYEYNIATDGSFDPEDGLLLKNNFQTGSHYKADSVTETLNSMPVVVTEDTSSFAQFTGESNKGWKGNLTGVGSSSLSIMFRMKDANRNADVNLVGSDNKNEGPVIWCTNGQIYLFPKKINVNRVVALNKSAVGAWKGTWEDWQHVTMAYNKNLRQIDVFLNGCLIHTFIDSELNLDNVCLGSQDGSSRKATCDIKYFRVYEKCLSAKEAGTLYMLDMFGNGENASTTKSAIELKLDAVCEELESLKMLYLKQVKGVTNE